VPSTDLDWQKAYAAQALSDLEAREVLASGEVDQCHRLHYLQMAAEKVCKAFIVAANGHDHVRKIHGYIASILPVLARQFYGLAGNAEPQAWEMQAIRHFAREIELLAPACDDNGSRQDNSEYPWLDGAGNVQIPCLYSFPKLDDRDRTIVRVIQLIRSAAHSYTQ
jgi:hypothetical protein